MIRAICGSLVLAFIASGILLHVFPIRTPTLQLPRHRSIALAESMIDLERPPTTAIVIPAELVCFAAAIIVGIIWTFLIIRRPRQLEGNGFEPIPPSGKTSKKSCQ